MGYNADLLKAARIYGRKYGIDPTLLIATTLVESGGRLDAVGDGGHSFGPYQMNDQGRLKSAGFTQQQAMNPYLATEAAAREYASVARRYGVSGAQLASDAQRPLDRAGYRKKINDALPQARAILSGQGGAIDSSYLNAPVTGSDVDSGDTTTAGGVPARPQLDAGTMQRLVKWIDDSSAAARRGEVLDLPAGTIEAVKAAKARALTAGSAPADDGHDHGAEYQTLSGGYAGELSGSPIDRAGAPTSQAILDYARRVSSFYGSPIQLGTGTQHNRMTTSGNVSAHWSGNALDLPSSGSNLTRMGQAALMAAGMPRAEALRQKGGLFNYGGYQIIFNSNTGGNHYDHLHVGSRR